VRAIEGWSRQIRTAQRTDLKVDDDTPYAFPLSHHHPFVFQPYPHTLRDHRVMVIESTLETHHSTDSTLPTSQGTTIRASRLNVGDALHDDFGGNHGRKDLSLEHWYGVPWRCRRRPAHDNVRYHGVGMGKGTRTSARMGRCPSRSLYFALAITIYMQPMEFAYHFACLLCDEVWSR